MHFHVLGVGPIGSLVAYHLRQAIPPSVPITLIHKNAHFLQKTLSMRNTIIVERDGVQYTSNGFSSEAFSLPEVRKVYLTQEQANATLDSASYTLSNSQQATQTQESLIQSLFVTIPAYAVVPSISELVPRLTPESTIVLLHNGMGVYERLVNDVFRNPEKRPHFIVSANSHGAFYKKYMHTVHSGVGMLTFGIVPDPNGRDYEAQLRDTDLPSTDQQLFLDSIMKPNEESTHYRYLRETVSALIQMQGLHAVWQPITHTVTAMQRKVVVNSVINPLTAIMHCRNGELFQTEPGLRIMRQVCWEAAAVFEAQAYYDTGLTDANDLVKSLQILRHSGRPSPLPPGLRKKELEKECLRVADTTAWNISSMLNSVQKGRWTEIDFMNGYLSRLGRTYGVPTPTISLLRDLVILRKNIPLDQVFK